MWRFIFFLACWLCIIFSPACLSHTVPSFKYLGNAPVAFIPLKVIPIYLDKGFGEADKLAIDDAIAQWNYALNGYVVLKVVSYDFDLDPGTTTECSAGRCWILIKIDSNATFIPKDKTHPDDATLAWANGEGGNHIYFIRDRIKTQWMTGVALHEMGNLLGAGRDNAYVMADKFQWEDTRCVDYRSIMLVATYQGIPSNAIKYCIYD